MDREIIPFFALVGSPGAAELTPWLTGIGIPFPGFLLLLSNFTKATGSQLK